MKLFGNSHGKKKSGPARTGADAYYNDPDLQAYEELQSVLKPRSDEELRRQMPEKPPVIRHVDPKTLWGDTAAEKPAPRHAEKPAPVQQPRQPAKAPQARPAAKNTAGKYADFDEYEPFRTEADKREIEAMIAAYQKKKLIRRVITLAVLVVLVVVGALLWKSWVKPPELPVVNDPVATPSQPVESNKPGDPEEPVVSTSPDPENSPAMPDYRREGVYTFLVVGNDDGNGNTDTMLVGAFDTVNHKLNIVSIPRDTLVNVNWNVKKANTILAFSDMDGLKEELSEIMGFQVDSYGVVDLDAFVALVDAVEGVDFDVPVDMHYEDPVQDLSIHINAGYQHLNGKQAVQVVRFRSGYVSGDIGRIETQQKFLKALAAKCLSLENLVKNASTYAHIFKTYVDTDLTLGNLIWYLQQFSKLEAGDINFYTLPGNGMDSVKGLSYVTIYADEWVEMINNHLSPLKEEIKVEDLGILTRDEYGNLHMTNGAEMYTNFYDNTGGSSSNNTEEEPDDEDADSETAEPSEAPEPSEEPDMGEPPVVDDMGTEEETEGGSTEATTDEAA